MKLGIVVLKTLALAAAGTAALAATGVVKIRVNAADAAENPVSDLFASCEACGMG